MQELLLILTIILPGVVLRCMQINKCDVIAGGRSLRPGTMASVGPEVSVWALSPPSFFYFHTVHSWSWKMWYPPAARKPLVHGRIVGVEVSFGRKLPAASLESLAFVLDRRAIECAGRCCAPEPEWSIRARYGLCSGGWSYMVPAHITVELVSSFSCSK